MKNMLKRGLSFGLAGLMLGGVLCGCGSTGKDSADTAPDAAQDTAEQPVELTVFAAASLTEALNEIAEQYKDCLLYTSATMTARSSKRSVRASCRPRGSLSKSFRKEKCIRGTKSA